MEKSNWQKVEQIVDQALTKSKDQRKTFIEQKCGDNKKLKSWITELLESIESSEGFLETGSVEKDILIPSIMEDLPDTPSTSLIDTQLGAYTVAELIDHGGMGSVYLAERTDGTFEHRVAIKIIRSGMDTPENIARFRQEQNILASLQHPNIGQLYDGGVTDEGLPYLVMEYIDGHPITQYCDKHHLSINKRLTLFRTVCKAVQHAHKNLIVHRDIKPSNILITNEGQVKILDFGIAKLQKPDNDNQSASLANSSGKMLTPAFAAPEQVKNEQITTATDTYALGVVLYQLLVGVLPFCPEKLNEGNNLEDLIVHNATIVPSTRYNNLCKDKKNNIAQKRVVTPSNLTKIVSGDLDAIVQKAISKGAQERYSSTEQLEEDIGRYLNKQPVLAHEGSISYYAKKFLQRNKWSLAIVSSFLILIVSFSVFYTLQIKKERNIAQTEARKAQEVKKFLVNIFQSSNPDKKNYKGPDVTAREVLVSGIDKAEKELQNQPVSYVNLLLSVGDALQNLHEYEEANKAFKKALDKSVSSFGSRDSITSNVLLNLSLLKNKERNYKEAEKFIQKAIDIKESIYGKNSIQLIQSYSVKATNLYLQSRYKEAITHFKKTDSLYVTHNKQRSLHHYTSYSNWASAEYRLGHYEKAESLLRSVLRFYTNYYGNTHYNIALTKSKLGNLYYQIGKHRKAEEILVEALSESITIGGNVYFLTSNVLGRLALNAKVMGKLKEAEAYATKRLTIDKKLYGKDDIRLSSTLNTLGLIQKDLGELRAAEVNLTKALNYKRQKVGKQHPDLAVPLYNLAHLLHAKEKYAQSLKLFKQVVNIDRKALGPTHPDIAIDLNKVGLVLRDMDKLNQADSVFTEANTIFKDKFPDNHHRVAEHLFDYGILKIKQGKVGKGKEMIGQSYHIFRNKFGPNHKKIQAIKETLSQYNFSLKDIVL